MSSVDITVLADAEEAARLVAERLAEQARAGGSIVLTGGSTPRRAYETAAELEPDWSRVELWWGDERCVPPDDERSNYRLAKRALLDRLGGRAAVHRIQGELGRDEGTAEYRLELSDVGTFDLVLLGLGPDGHVASLFPNFPTLDVTGRDVVGSDAGYEPFVDRISHDAAAPLQHARASLPRCGRGQGGRGRTGVRRRAVAPDARQPGPLG